MKDNNTEETPSPWTGIFIFPKFFTEPLRTRIKDFLRKECGYTDADIEIMEKYEMYFFPAGKNDNRFVIFVENVEQEEKLYIYWKQISGDLYEHFDKKFGVPEKKILLLKFNFHYPEEVEAMGEGILERIEKELKWNGRKLVSEPLDCIYETDRRRGRWRNIEDPLDDDDLG